MAYSSKTPPPPPPAQAGEKYIVRFPEGMRDRIAEAAKANNRSMNAEIVARLEDSFAPSEAPATKEQLESILKVIQNQQETVKMLGNALRAISEVPVPNRTPIGKKIASGFANVGGLFGEGKVREGYSAMNEITKALAEWSETPEGRKALEVDRRKFPPPDVAKRLDDESKP